MAENKQKGKIKGYDPYTGEPIYDNSAAGIKKVLIAVIICVAVTAAGIIGWLVYDNFFNLTEVDLMADYAWPEYEGYSGSGEIVSLQQEYEGDWLGEGRNLDAFYENIEYVVDKPEGLSNGDTVTVTALYDKAAAKAAKIKVTNDSSTFEVSGLVERFKSDGSDIPNESLNTIKQYMSDYVDRDAGYFKNDFSNDGMVKLFYVSATVESESWGNRYYNDQLIAVFKTSYTEFDTRVTEYISVRMMPMDKGLNYEQIDTLVDDGTLSIDHNTYYDDGLDDVVKSITTDHNRDTVTELKV